MYTLLHCYIATLLKNNSTIQQFNNSRGQVIVILLLLMLVALSIGLAVTQRSVTDVTTSTQTEQSSRAFSAAEAGLEKALSGQMSGSFSLDNSASSNIQASAWLPDSANPGAGIEYPPIGRETTAQFWFTDPRDLDPNNTNNTYQGDSTWLYFGNPNAYTENDLPAVEVEIVMLANNKFYSQTYYYDSDPTRVSSNNFKPASCSGNAVLTKGILGDNHVFYCRVQLPEKYSDAFPNLGGAGNCYSSSCRLILARVRLLYSNQNHKIALAPVGNAQLPRQVQIYNSTGIAGQSQKQIQAFRVKDVVPPWFNFAVFSINEIRK